MAKPAARPRLLSTWNWDLAGGVISTITLTLGGYDIGKTLGWGWEEGGPGSKRGEEASQRPPFNQEWKLICQSVTQLQRLHMSCLWAFVWQTKRRNRRAINPLKKKMHRWEIAGETQEMATFHHLLPALDEMTCTSKLQV